MKGVSALRDQGIRGVVFEVFFFVSTVAILFCKFHFVGTTLSSRYVLTAVTFFGSVGVLLLLASPLLLLPPRPRRYGLLFLNAALSLLVLADLLYMRFYNDLFTLRNLALTGQASEVMSSVVALIKYSDLLYFIDLPILALLALRVPSLGTGVRFFKRSCAALLLLLFAASCVNWKVNDYNRAVRGALKALWDRPSVAVGTGILVYHWADARNIASEMAVKKALKPEEERRIALWLNERNSERHSASLSPLAAAGGKNLILIQVESLQGFTVGLRLGGELVAPNLTRLAGESLYFTRAYNQTAGGNSSDAEFMVNTSLFPTAKGVAYVRFAGNNFNSLAWSLKEKGYTTAALHGDRPGFWNRNHMYPALGFDHYLSKNDFVPEESIGLGLSDRSFFKQSLSYMKGLKSEGKPFYAFLVTLTSHHPFNFAALREQVKGLDLGDLEETMLGDYLRSVRYVDDCIGEFFAGLEKEGLLDESLVVIYGDHPAVPRGERDSLSKLLGRNLEGAAAWRDIQAVPLMIRLPEALGRRVDSPTGQMDIAPTVASLLGIPLSTAFGRDLTDEKALRGDDLVVFRNGTYVRGDVWVNPSEQTAHRLDSGAAEPFDDTYSIFTEEAARRLSFSDRILENNLIRRLNTSEAIASLGEVVPDVVY